MQDLGNQGGLSWRNNSYENRGLFPICNLSGNLISETTTAGSGLKDYIWQGVEPVTQIDATSNDEVTYLHSDHLATPRLGTNSAGTITWRWESNAFGNTDPEDDPDGNTINTTVNLRFPGQYKDEESGLFYNWNRYYDPNIGRYITSDPLGLEVGINTFGYSFQNSLRYADPDGLAVQLCLFNPACTTGVVQICITALKAISVALGLGLTIELIDCEGDKSCPLKAESTEGETEKRPPPGSKPIDKTDWSGDHGDIKEGIGAGPTDNVVVDSDNNVWGQNPDGSWSNHGPAGNFTGSGQPSGRKGKDRKSNQPRRK